VNGVDLIAIKQYTLGKRRFSRINMRANAYIPHLEDCCLSDGRPSNGDAHSVITLLISVKWKLKNDKNDTKSRYMYKYSKVFN
jgi:hypothetical protein